MAQSFQTSQIFIINPSCYLKRFVDFLHLLALLAAGLNALPVIYRSVAGGVVVMLWLASRKYWKISASRLRYTENKGWEMAFDGMDYKAGKVLADTVVTQWVVFLRFKADAQSTMPLIIAKDSLSADDFRRLRVKLMLSECERD